MDVDDTNTLRGINGGTNSSSNNNDTNNVDINSLSDSEAIKPEEITDAMCIINVPLIYVDANLDNPQDQVIPNLRAIDYKMFTELMTMAIDIPKLSNDDSVELTHKLIRHLMSNVSNVDDIKSVLEFLEFTSDMSKKFDLDDDYIDVTSECISFDLIRKYIVDKNGILISADPMAYKKYEFYSQLPTAEDVLLVRNLNHDTDFNRMQFALCSFEKTLTFQPGYIYDKTVKLTNLALWYLILYSMSRRIDTLCSVDLRSNMIAYMIDIVIRTRVIQAWQRSTSGRKLLTDMIKNYDNKNHIVSLCKLATPRERAQYMLKILADMQSSAEVRNDASMKNIPIEAIVSNLNYDWYEEALETTAQIIHNRKYYVFTSDFVVQITSKVPDIMSQFAFNASK